MDGELEQVRLLGGSLVQARLDDLLRPTLLALRCLLAMPDAPRAFTDVSGRVLARGMDGCRGGCWAEKWIRMDAALGTGSLVCLVA